MGIPRNSNGTFAGGKPRPGARTGKEIKCSLCGKEVYKQKCHLKEKGHNYCSTKCWNETQFNRGKSKKVSVCPNCGNNFKSSKFSTGRWQVYCSQICYIQHKWSRFGPAFDGKGGYRKCNYCGKKFWSIPSRRVRNRNIYCSKDCANAYKTAENTFFSKCLGCGKDIQKPNSLKQRSVMGYFCSHKCFSGYAIREKSNSWDGGWYMDAHGRYHIFIGRKHRGGNQYKLRSRVIVELVCSCVLLSNWGILHLNNDVSDDRICNLYICNSMSELRRIQSGRNFWPKNSNIQEYKDKYMPSPKLKYTRFTEREITLSVKQSGVELIT